LEKNVLKRDIFLLDGVRTPIGSPFKSFNKLTAVDLATAVIKELLRRNKLRKSSVDEVILGNAVSAGLGQNPARQSAVLAGLSETIPAYTVNNVCGAGLQAVINGVQTILANEGRLLICGGAESATHAPFLVNRYDVGTPREGNLVDSSVYDGLTCQITGRRMGDLVEAMAKRHRISRKAQDEYTLNSHYKASVAIKEDVFYDEIVSVRVSSKKVVKKDDRPRGNLVIQTLNALPPAFKRRGTITAGNASTPCDGAAAVIVASKGYLKKIKIRPMARLLDYVSITDKPELTFESAVKAIDLCLKKCDLSVEDMDLFEVGEAFAAQMILIKEKLKIPDERLNVYGGDIAYGHPLGAAGTRNLVTLMHSLIKWNLKRGLVCISYGGGGSIAMIIEKV